MKRLLFVLTLFPVVWTSSCSGGSSTVVTPPTGGFNNASLSGAYVFSMTGSTADSTFGTSSFSRVGVFSADGKGDIATTGGLEDVHKFGADSIFSITGGSYVVNADGRGTLSLITSGGTVQYSISLVSPSNGYMVDMDTGVTTAGDAETASGSFALQTATNISVGTYVFDFAGIAPDGTGSATSIIGDLVAGTAGSGSFAAGSFWDANEGGNLISKASISGGSYATDNTNSGTGRGTAVINGANFVYYVVDSQHVQFMGIDQDAAAPGTILGEGVAQQAGTPNNVSSFSSSSFVFVMAGSDTISLAPLTRAGRLTANGASLASILLDNNDAGLSKTVPSSGVLNAGTVTLDGDGTGRGTFTFTDTVNNTGTFTFVFYMSSATQGVIQDISTVMVNGAPVPVDVADGTLLAQTGGPFSSSSLAKSYAFNWSGASPLEEDFVGAFKPAATSPNGVVDYNEFGALPAGKLFPNTPFNGVITFGGDGTGSTGQHSTFVAGLTGSPTVTIHYFAYFANPSTILLMGTDPSRVIAGVLTAQTQ
jgi:hypothetical protein